MKLVKSLLAIIVVSTINIGCNNSPTTQINNTVKTDSLKVGETAKKTNYELLQGKWQSEDDKTNFLVFEKNRRKEIAGGMDTWDEEEFILSDHCENGSNEIDNSPREQDKYISCKESDLCWYIVSLTEERLTLQYLGRGNMLVYKRVKE